MTFGQGLAVLVGVIFVAILILLVRHERISRALHKHWEARAGAHLIDMIRKGKGGI